MRKLVMRKQLHNGPVTASCLEVYFPSALSCLYTTAKRRACYSVDANESTWPVVQPILEKIIQVMDDFVGQFCHILYTFYSKLECGLNSKWVN